MATIEHKAPPVPSPAPADPVFSADDGRRARVLRIVGRFAALVAGVWLLALLAGAMGFGHLPGLPGSGLLDQAAPAKAPAETPRANRGTGVNQSFAARTFASHAVGAQHQAGSSRVSHRTPAPPPPPAVQPPAGQAPPPAIPPPSPGKPRGRAVRRHGVHTQPAPPPPGKAKAKGQDVVNPGRLKHQLPPPPPPPPPPPKKP
jgi:hypothetical protein